MKKHAIVTALTAFSLALGGSAYAQSDKDVRADQAARGHSGLVLPRDRGRPASDRGNDRGNDRGSDRGDYRGNDRGPDRGRPAGYQGSDRGPGAGPEHNFYRGGRLPDEYRNRQYVVDDWRGHNLSAPPRGYHWVQAGGDYVLAAIATGVIASILLNH